jgi:hypothetical protein
MGITQTILDKQTEFSVTRSTGETRNFLSASPACRAIYGVMGSAFLFPKLGNSGLAGMLLLREIACWVFIHLAWMCFAFVDTEEDPIQTADAQTPKTSPFATRHDSTQADLVHHPS